MYTEGLNITDDEGDVLDMVLSKEQLVRHIIIMQYYSCIGTIDDYLAV